MLTFVAKYGGNVFSQCGEDGIIKEVLSRLNKIGGTYIEFGAHDGIFCSNTRLLLSGGNSWKGYYYEADPELFKQCCENCLGMSINVFNELITPDNINKLPECDLLSMDTDGEDYRLWQAYKGKPDIVIIEINSSLEPMRDAFTSTTGASYITMLKLGIKKGYFLLCHTGNMIFVLNKHKHLFPEIIGNGIDNYELYFNTSWQ